MPRRALQTKWQQSVATRDEPHLRNAIVAWAVVWHKQSGSVRAIAKVSRRPRFTLVDEVSADAAPGRPAEGRGLARAALLFLVRYIVPPPARAHRIVLQVRIANTAARGLYASLDFKESEEDVRIGADLIGATEGHVIMHRDARGFAGALRTALGGRGLLDGEVLSVRRSDGPCEMSSLPHGLEGGLRAHVMGQEGDWLRYVPEAAGTQAEDPPAPAALLWHGPPVRVPEHVPRTEGAFYEYAVDLDEVPFGSDTRNVGLRRTVKCIGGEWKPWLVHATSA